MSSKDALFLLIKALSRSEKRYFKVFTNTDKRYNNYLKLFDAIDKQEEYDEVAIKKKFGSEKFVRQLHVTKNYLKELIYKSNRNFHSASSKAIMVRDTLTNVEILFNKELFKNARDEIRSAEKIALKYELFGYLTEIIEWKRKLAQQMEPHNYALFKEYLNQQTYSILKLSNQNQYVHLIVDISSRIFGSREEMADNEEWLDNEENALSLDALVMHYNARYFRNIQRNLGDEGERDLLHIIDHFEKDSFWLKAKPGTYLTTLNNLITYYTFNKDFKSAKKYMDKAKFLFEEIRPTSENKSLIKQMLRTYNIELEVYRDQGIHGPDFDLDETEAFIEKYRFKMPAEYLISFWFQFAYIRFMQGDFKDALVHINKILQTNFKETRTDIQTYSRFLNLFIHLEENNMFVLRYFVDSTRRFIRKRKKTEKWERVLLGFFSKMGRIPAAEYSEQYVKLHKQLFPERAEDHLMTDDQLDYLDVRRWLEGKLGSR